MNRIRLVITGTILMFALTTVAQQTTTSNNAHDSMGGGPTVESN
jgi:hypothetical protein